MLRSLSLAQRDLSSSLSIATVAILLAAAGPSLAAEPVAACRTAALLESTGSWRGWTGGELERFRLEVAAPGLVAVEIATPRVEANSVKLDLAKNGCAETQGGGIRAPVSIIEQSPARLVLAVEAHGTVWLRAAARHAGRYRIVTSFRAIDGADRAVWRRKNEAEIVDPDPLTPPPPMIAPDPGSRWGNRGDLCGVGGREDDHGDTLFCATWLRLAEPVRGEIGNPWNDDLDVFALALDSVATVEIHLGGDAAVAASLHDRAGRRLAVEDEAGRSGELSTDLGPGLYFIRVEGGDALHGAYEITAAARPW